MTDQFITEPTTLYSGSYRDLVYEGNIFETNLTSSFRRRPLYSRVGRSLNNFQYQNLPFSLRLSYVSGSRGGSRTQHLYTQMTDENEQYYDSFAPSPVQIVKTNGVTFPYLGGIEGSWSGSVELNGSFTGIQSLTWSLNVGAGSLSGSSVFGIGEDDTTKSIPIFIGTNVSELDEEFTDTTWLKAPYPFSSRYKNLQKTFVLTDKLDQPIELTKNYFAKQIVSGAYTDIYLRDGSGIPFKGTDIGDAMIKMSSSFHPNPSIPNKSGIVSSDTIGSLYYIGSESLLRGQAPFYIGKKIEDTTQKIKFVRGGFPASVFVASAEAPIENSYALANTAFTYLADEDAVPNNRRYFATGPQGTFTTSKDGINFRNEKRNFVSGAVTREKNGGLLSPLNFKWTAHSYYTDGTDRKFGSYCMIANTNFGGLDLETLAVWTDNPDMPENENWEYFDFNFNPSGFSVTHRGYGLCYADYGTSGAYVMVGLDTSVGSAGPDPAEIWVSKINDPTFHSGQVKPQHWEMVLTIPDVAYSDSPTGQPTGDCPITYVPASERFVMVAASGSDAEAVEINETLNNVHPGIWYSDTSDPAGTWTSINAQTLFSVGDAGRLHAVAADPSGNSNVVVAVGVSGSIMRSTDGGVNWSIVSPISSPADDYFGHYFSVKRGWDGIDWVAVGEHGRIMVSEDEGVTWTRVSGAVNGQTVNFAPNGDTGTDYGLAEEAIAGTNVELSSSQCLQTILGPSYSRVSGSYSTLTSKNPDYWVIAGCEDVPQGGGDADEHVEHLIIDDVINFDISSKFRVCDMFIRHTSSINNSSISNAAYLPRGLWKNQSYLGEVDVTKASMQNFQKFFFGFGDGLELDLTDLTNIDPTDSDLALFNSNNTRPPTSKLTEGFGKNTPSVKEFDLARSYDETGRVPAEVVRLYEPQLRGFVYGLINGNPQNLKAIWRRDRYGQYRDMMEQRPYTKVFIATNIQSNIGPQEAAVVVNFVSGTTAFERAKVYLTASSPDFNLHDSGIYDFEYKAGQPWFDDRPGLS